LLRVPQIHKEFRCCRTVPGIVFVAEGENLQNLAIAHQRFEYIDPILQIASAVNDSLVPGRSLLLNPLAVSKPANIPTGGLNGPTENSASAVVGVDLARDTARTRPILGASQTFHRPGSDVPIEVPAICSLWCKGLTDLRLGPWIQVSKSLDHPNHMNDCERDIYPRGLTPLFVP
jgi:hypothetical protein